MLKVEKGHKNELIGAHTTLAKDHPRMALSAYHRPGDPEKIPELVRQGWAGYHTVCGRCEDRGTSIVAAVLYFY